MFEFLGRVILFIVLLPIAILKWLFSDSEESYNPDEKRWEKDYRHNRDDILRETGMSKNELDKVLSVLDKHHVI